MLTKTCIASSVATIGMLLLSTSLHAQGLYSWRDEYGVNHLTQELPPSSCKSKDCKRLLQQRQEQLDKEAKRSNEETARKREQELASIEKQIAEEKLQRELAQQRTMQQYYEPGVQKDMPLGKGQIKCWGKGILWVNGDDIFGINGTGREVARRQGWKDGTQFFSPATLQQLIAKGKAQCGF